MASSMDQLETKLNDVFGKKAPQLPESAKKMIVEYAPWVSLIVGLFGAWSAWVLFQWAQAANSALGNLNALCSGTSFYNTTGCSSVATSGFTLWIWLGLAVLIVEAVLCLMAFTGLREHKKAGWNFIYWGALVNIAYAVVSLFSSYNGSTNFVGALIGSAIGLWLLFQIRSHYTSVKASSAKSTK